MYHNIYLLHGVFLRRCEAPGLFHWENSGERDGTPISNLKNFRGFALRDRATARYFFPPPPSADEERSVKFL